MKIALPNAWAGPSGPRAGARAAPEGKPAAFQQVLRVMEKEMWPGAEPGQMTGDRLPEPSARHAANSGNAQAASAARPDVGAGAAALGRNRTPPASSPSFTACVADSPAFALSAQPLRASTYAFSTTQTPAPVTPDAPRIPAPLAGPHSPPTTLDLPASRAPVVRPVERFPALTSASGTPPYRVTVMTGASGVSIALRVNNASADELESLKQNALAEARGVRLVVNGIDQTPTPSRGTSHGY
ncbi:hypothetical protein [Paraburkholderia terricola]|uniref:Hook-length control protein FliK n=1 Tax=Paraburkholderia terricola TaxID=169427 RepID=A0ABU1LX29_9BURK|nr:hypothetical protein [Paraburkholderia terricola]MDR6411316.1 hypothetical protein [Paraburkholderia terricola]MDR6483444.1 hypothetical protein [Paraburkholderia terricola]